jgi:hypothetical protein
MDIEIDQFKCGQCGEEKHKLYRRDITVEGVHHWEILTECTKCQLKSIITLEPAHLKVEWHEDSGANGVIATGWSK